MSSGLSRRDIGRAGALLLAGAVLGACADPGPDERPAMPSTPSGAPEPPAPSPSPSPALPAARPWRAGDGEVQPRIKHAATTFIERAGTWEDGEGGRADVVRRVRSLGGADAAQTAAVLAHSAPAAVTRVIYPQYGGLNARHASVMVLARQSLLRADGTVARREFALDVRIDRSGATPVVTGIEPPVPLGEDRAPSATARAVLADDAIGLAAPAAADVRGGHVTDDLLEILRGLARTYRLDVQVFRTGHPLDVFETGRTSNHTRGRAVDIWRIDGTPVVEAPRRLLSAVLTEAGRLGATEVGGPFDLNGSRPGYFTDDVHQDHLHVAVTAGKAAARP